MGATCGRLRLDRSDERIRDDNLSRYLDRMNQQELDVLKLLLLGSGDSGKTTILKQMHILYGKGIGQQKRAQAKKPLFRELVLGAKETIAACGEIPKTRAIRDEKTLEQARIIEEYNVESQEYELPPRIARAIDILWKDPDVQQTWSQRSHYQVLESWGSFASKCWRYPKWGGPSWIPSQKEYLFTRIKTVGVIQETFHVDGTSFQIVDVGGQRNERRKWIHYFEGVTAVIFVAAISEYDQCLAEDRKKNRLEEALDLFGSINNSYYFENTTVLLFLNKADIFREKLCERKIRLNVSGLFPNAPRGTDYDDGVEWVRDEFLKRNAIEEKTIFAHVTTATDTKTVKHVLDACKHTILRQTMQELNFYP